jgi:hypothetical protein
MNHEDLNVTTSNNWGTTKTLRDIAEAYSAVYEGKGDGNLANNYPPYDKVTRGDVIAGALGKDQEGGKKKKKVAKEETEIVDEKYMGFKKLEASIAARGGVRDPGAVAASIGRKKYGKEKFQKAAATDHKMNEATAMAKRGYDETEIRNKIAKSTGGGEAADRANTLADKKTFGYGNPQARNNYARKQMGDFRKTNSSNPGLHGYGHKSNDPDVKAKQAARGAQRGSATLTPNEKKKLNMGEAYDLYDIILSHLIDEGYADTQEQAEVIMVNMSDEWRDSIIETRMDPRGRPASGPMNVYAKSKGKPDQAHLDAVKAYNEKQKKKTPEQRKKELDDYKEGGWLHPEDVANNIKLISALELLIPYYGGTP